MEPSNASLRQNRHWGRQEHTTCHSYIHDLGESTEVPLTSPPGEQSQTVVSRSTKYGHEKYIHFDYVHLWMAGAGAAAALTFVATFSPWFRQWNPALTRRDVVWKATGSSMAGGCVGYTWGRALQMSADEENDDSLRTMRRVRQAFRKLDKPSFVASHPQRFIMSSERPDDPPSTPPALTERISSLCYQLITTSQSIYSIRACLEPDLLVGGVSRYDANIIVTSLASALDRSVWDDSYVPNAVASTLAFVRGSRRLCPCSVFLGAPAAVCVLALFGDSVLFGALLGICLSVDVPAMPYTTLIQDKAAVAAVLRRKFRKELEA